jgi:hypothetical protein
MVTVEALLGREAPPLTPADVVTPDGRIKVTVDTSSKPTFDTSGKALQIDIPIGTKLPVSCVLRPDAPAPGSLLVSLVQNVQKQFTPNEIGVLDVGVVGATPYHFAEVEYRVEQDGKPLLGSFKVASLQRDDTTVVCFHDEPGYRGAFKKIVEDFARTFTRAHASVGQSVESEVETAKIGQVPVGYSVSRTFLAQGGGKMEVSRLSMVVKRSPTDLSSTDSTTTKLSGKDGVVSEIRVIEVEGGEVAKDLVMTKKAAGKYGVKGTVSGKDVKGDFTAAPPIVSDAREHDEVRTKLLSGPKLKELSLTSYSPGVDPLASTTDVWRSTEAPNVFDTTMGGMKAKVTVDETGHATKALLSLGAMDMTIERVFFEGGKKP